MNSGPITDTGSVPMDLATELALRAIIRGLLHSDAISTRQVRGVLDALKDAAAEAMDRREPDTAKQLLALGKAIRADADLN